MCGVDAVQQLGPGGTLPPPGFAAQLARGLLQRPSECRLLQLLVVVVVVVVVVVECRLLQLVVDVVAEQRLLELVLTEGLQQAVAAR